MGFTKVLTEFATYGLNQPENASRAPEGRVTPTQAQADCFKFWTGKTKMLDLMQTYGFDNIVLGYAEPCSGVSLAGRILQENILMLTAVKEHWKFAVVINIHRFPLMADPNSPGKSTKDLFLGFNTSQHPIMDAQFWGLIDKVIVG